MEDKKRNFKEFRLNVDKTKRSRLPLHDRIYSRWGYRESDPVTNKDFTLEQLNRRCPS